MLPNAISSIHVTQQECSIQSILLIGPTNWELIF